MQKPTKIIEIIKEKSEGKGKPKFLYLCDNGITYNKQGLANAVGLAWTTLVKRIKAYGFDSPLVLQAGKIPKNIGNAARLTPFKKVKSCTDAPEETGIIPVKTMSGRVVYSNGSFDDELFPLPDASRSTIVHPRKDRPKRRKTSKSNVKRMTAQLASFNALAETRGYLRPVEFKNNAIFGG